VSKPSVEALYVSVLHRLGWLDVHQGGLLLLAPTPNVPTGQLPPLLTPQALRCPSCFDNPLQNPRHSPAAETGIHFQPEALPRERIDHFQHPNTTYAADACAYE